MGLAADALTAVIPATLAGSIANASRRANERPNAGRRSMIPPSLVCVPVDTLAAPRKALAKTE
jgi:hypothetical protein